MPENGTEGFSMRADPRAKDAGMRLTITTAKRTVIDVRLWERCPEPEPDRPTSPISHLGFASTETRYTEGA